MSTLIERNHTTTRTLKDAIQHANQLEEDLPYLIQPENSVHDLIILKNTVLSDTVWIQTSNSTNIICGLWKQEPTMDQRIEDYSKYLGKNVNSCDVLYNTILKEHKVNI